MAVNGKIHMNNDTTILDNNKVYLVGIVVSTPIFSHEIFEEKFFEFMLEVSRLSCQRDVLPITVSEKLIKSMDLSIGKTIALNGQFRSYNKIVDERSRLMLTVFARDFVQSQDSNPNIVELKGYICKAPIYRTTPFSREICDILVAVNRSYKKSDYIPCIAWGRNARFVRDVPVGQKLTLKGRIQSREYVKKISDTESITKVAYEVSINKIGVDDSVQYETDSIMQNINERYLDSAFAQDNNIEQN